MNKLIEDTTWEQFEAVPSGQITKNQITFRMRVGIYLGKPIQAILAGDLFIKIRPFPDQGYLLETLITDNASSYLYPKQRTSIRGDHIIPRGSLSWHPPVKPAFTFQETWFNPIRNLIVTIGDSGC